jgi:hypothetical protein
MSLLGFLKNMTLLARKMPGYHSFWTEPMSKVQMQDYELVSLIASVLYYKSHSGPMYLVSDRRGIDYLNSLKLTALYDKVIELQVDKTINSKIFWAAGKIFAHAQMPCPSISIDMDAIVWKPIRVFNSSVAVALHTEPTDWPPYGRSWPSIKGPWSSVDASKVDPVNTGIVAFLDQKFKTGYIDASLSFMREFSRSGLKSEKVDWTHGPSYIDEMVYAEQMMLSLMAKSSKRSIKTVASYDRFADHMSENSIVTHLWNSKRGYRDHSRARDAFLHDMIEMLLHDFPESRKFIASSGIATLAVRDSNTGAIRYSKQGEWVLPGEEIEHL